MVNVNVKVHSMLREMVGEPNVAVKVSENSSVRDVLDKVIREYKDGVEQRYRWVGGERDLLKYCVIFLNNKHLPGKSISETKVGEGDIIEITEPISGG